MIIKIIAEKGEDNITEVEHYGVKDFFIFGVKKEDEHIVDFHDWNGSFRYMISNLAYYTELIKLDERANSLNVVSQSSPNISNPFPNIERLNPPTQVEVKVEEENDGVPDETNDEHDGEEETKNEKYIDFKSKK